MLSYMYIYSYMSACSVPVIRAKYRLKFNFFYRHSKNSQISKS